MKKILTLSLTLLFALAALASAQKVVNAQASSGEKGEYGAGAAVDRNMATRWGSAFDDNQWITFEFDKPETLYGVRIVWETAAGLSYKVLTSLDGKAWTAAAAVTDGAEGEDKRINFASPVSAKFVKIECLERATEWGFSIFEVEFNLTSKKLVELRPAGKAAPSYPEGTSFFKVVKQGGIFWLQDPDGKPTISKAVNCVIAKDGSVKPDGKGYDVLGKYKEKSLWAKAALQRLRTWGFNGIGCWSDDATFAYDTPFTVILNIQPPAAVHRLADVWDPAFEKNTDKLCKKRCSRLAKAKYLIGYFLENEQPWYGDFGWYTGHEPRLLEIYMKLPATAPGKLELIKFLQSRYPKIKEFNRVWGVKLKKFDALASLTELPGSPEAAAQANADRNDFAGLVADRYFKVATEAVRRYDPNHLVMGVRFAGGAPKPIVQACGKYNDIVSFNYYAQSMVINKGDWNRIHVFSGYKPVLISEFSYRAMENSSGDANTRGAPVTVPTQKDRALGFERYVSQAMSFPYCVGYHWFQLTDESPQGRSFDGEDSNYGILDVNDQEYAVLTAKMKEVNAKADDLHKNPLPASEITTNVTSGGGHASVEAGDASLKREAGAGLVNLAGKGTAWGDSGAGASLTVSVEKGKKGADVMVLTTKAEGWGCGISIPVALAPPNADGSGNLQGFSGVLVRFKAPAGLKFRLFLNESGVAAPGQSEYKGLNGADGESFTSEEIVSTGKETAVKLDFSRFQVRSEWGNQFGNKTVNLKAVAGADLFFPAGSSGETRISEISLY
jgi:hypothetical protein